MVKVIRDGKDLVVLFSKDELQSRGKGVVAMRLRERRESRRKSQAAFKYYVDYLYIPSSMRSEILGQVVKIKGVRKVPVEIVGSKSLGGRSQMFTVRVVGHPDLQFVVPEAVLMTVGG